MTRDQKQLLRAVPVAAIIFGGLFASQYTGARKVADQLAEAPALPPPVGAGPQQVQDATDRLRVAVDLQSIAAIERQLEKDEEFVRSAEVLYPTLRAARHAETRKQQDEQVDKAVAAIGRRQMLLQDVRGDKLPDGARERVAAAQSRCTALIERLTQCRQPTGPAETTDK